MLNSKLTKKQVINVKKHVVEDNKKCTLYVKIRWDDECGNGHNSFAITGTLATGHRTCKTDAKIPDRAIISCGCIHETIEKHCPELKQYLRWHLCSSDGPMHYIGNTTYHASDKDHNGLRKGEKRQIINGRSKKPSWQLAAVIDGQEHPIRISGYENYIDSDEKPENITESIQYVPWCRVGEGKEANLEAARNCAVWPEATLEQLQDKEALEARLPALMEQMKSDIIKLGFEW